MAKADKHTNLQQTFFNIDNEKFFLEQQIRMISEGS